VPIEILGWSVKPEISIDIAAVGALIASPLIFWIGYRRTKRTEEIKTVNDLINKMDRTYKTRYLFFIKKPYSNDSREGQIQWFNEHIRYLVALQGNIRYLDVLVRNKDIRAKHLFNHCRGAVNFYLDYLDEYYTWVEREAPEHLRKELNPRYHAEIPYLRQIWKEERVSI